MVVLQEFEDASLLTAADKQARRAAKICRDFFWRQRIGAATDICPDAIRAFLAGAVKGGLSRKTAKNYLSAISRFCEFVGLADNPCRLVKLGRIDKPIPVFLTRAEVRQARAAARQTGVGVEFELAIQTGLRLGEMQRLRWSDVDMAARLVRIRKSKSGLPRAVPLNKRARIALRRQRLISGHLSFVFPARQTYKGGWKWADRPRGHTYWNRIGLPLQQAVAKFRERPGCSSGRLWHVLRHSFATRCAAAGIDCWQLAKWLGHSDVKTTEIYVHLAAGYDEKIERVN